MVTADVPVAGVDTPEIRGRCTLEKEMAVDARNLVTDRTDGAAGVVSLHGIEHVTWGPAESWRASPWQTAVTLPPRSSPPGLGGSMTAAGGRGE